MNEDAKQFAVSWLKEKGYLKNLTGMFVLELIECYLEQSHDIKTVDEVPKLFFLLYEDLKFDGYLN